VIAPEAGIKKRQPEVAIEIRDSGAISSSPTGLPAFPLVIAPEAGIKKRRPKVAIKIRDSGAISSYPAGQPAGRS
jgi:hypothetical protein